MEGQDWKEVIFKKVLSKPSQEVENKTKQKIKTDDEIEEKGKQKLSNTDKMSMAKLRVACGFKTQKTLADATRGKISSARINELESGKGSLPNGSEKQILFKLIKIKFK